MELKHYLSSFCIYDPHNCEILLEKGFTSNLKYIIPNKTILLVVSKDGKLPYYKTIHVSRYKDLIRVRLVREAAWGNKSEFFPLGVNLYKITKALLPYYEIE